MIVRGLSHIALAALAAAALPARAHAQAPAPADPSPVDEGSGESPIESPGDAPIIVAPVEVHDDRRATGVDALVSVDAASADAGRALDDPAFVTVVRVEDRAGETTSVAEVLARSLGVHVRSLGGLGAYSSISVRGASAGHTTVLIDGVPLSRVASVGADLNRFPLESFSELELYRGGVPVGYGGAALGGALNLRTRVGTGADGETLRLSAGAGSFGARHLRARWLGGDERRGVHLGLGYAGARGDFTYFNDNGTNLNQSDDAFVERTNNGYDQLDAVARGRWSGAGMTLSAGARTQWKDQGIPGLASVQSEAARLGTLAQLVDATLAMPVGSAQLSATAFGQIERQHFEDLAGEVGVGIQDRRYWSLSGGLDGRISALWGRHAVSLGSEGRIDHFREDDALRAAGDMTRATGTRLASALALADDIALADERLVVQPAVRLDVQWTRPLEDTDHGGLEPDAYDDRVDLHPSPRLSARLRATPWLTFKSSAGSYFRAPTVLELFGDRGFVVGNPALEPETGLSGDVGAVLATDEPLDAGGVVVDRVIVETALFGLRPRNTIVFDNGGGVAIAQNVGDSAIWGAEAAGSLRLARALTLSGNYTYIDSRQDSPMPSFDGKRLPQRPRHQLYGRVDAAQQAWNRVWTVWTDLGYTSGNFLDAANVNRVPDRLLWGAGLKFQPAAGWLVGVEAKNLTDARVESIELSPPPRPDLTRVPRAVADFFGYPLPGRAFYLTVEWALTPEE